MVRDNVGGVVVVGSEVVGDDVGGAVVGEVVECSDVVGDNASEMKWLKLY